MGISIIRGKQFLLCDELGDITDGAHGLFAHDARHLSRWRLLIDGARPQALGESHGQYLERTFVQRSVRTANLTADAVLVRRRIVLGDEAMYERIELRNVGAVALRFPLELDARADFDDIFTVKDQEFSRLGDDTGEVGPGGDGHHDTSPPTLEGGIATLRGDGVTECCEVTATRPFDVVEGRLRWSVEIEPRTTWTCDVQVSWGAADAAGRAGPNPLEPGELQQQLDFANGSIRAWRDSMPHLQCHDPGIERAWRTSIDDLGALRISTGEVGDDDLLTAAGAPWFMTIFGRDSLITCLQTLLLGPHRARGVLRYLARWQSTTDDPTRDAEPGKILHEVREGAIASRGYDVYYGSIDSTPLFLMLLGEYHAWTGDDDLVRELWPAAQAALLWIEEHGDLDGDGFLEYARRTRQGLENQSWKDSWDSQRHGDGTLASGPIAPVEVQAYAYAARLAVAGLARGVLGDADLADRLEAAAASLRERFETAYWLPGDGDVPGTYALALDGAKQPVGTLTSNIGHLAWCGIGAPDRVAQLAQHLVSTELWSGWGVRTMSRSERAYNPISYHCGTVWPHDTAIAAAGLARAGHAVDAARLARGLFDAADHFGGRLPEVFAGLAREGNPWPVRYPTASSPQAWAAGAPVQLLTALLGVQPDTAARCLVSRAERVPSWLEGTRITGVRAFDQAWSISVEDGLVRVAAT